MDFSKVSDLVYVAYINSNIASKNHSLSKSTVNFLTLQDFSLYQHFCISTVQK